MSDKAEKLCHAIDDLLLSHPRKALVVDPEVQELLRVGQLRRQAGRRIAAIGASRQEESWQRLEATLRAR
ncbi:MAG: hypothetical protein AMJ38_00695 [Dehalococcoidia bacterium DG_22]|nr:MAG: hypothetical protein AMJ38_00695 [Dehalococcoidia bacterium DG_22]